MATLLQPHAHVASTSDILARIREADCNLAIWERQSPVDCEGLNLKDAANVRANLSVAACEEAVRAELNDAGFAEGSARDNLTRDVAQLARLYADVMSLNEVNLRVEVVTTNACRKFHGDYVEARLITTYCGTGTQWLSQEDAERVARGEEPKAMQTMAAGDVGLFKGKLVTDHPAIHRSPPIEGTGETRLLVVMNPPS